MRAKVFSEGFNSSGVNIFTIGLNYILIRELLCLLNVRDQEIIIMKKILFLFYPARKQCF